MTYPILYLKKGRDQALERLHPWIFSGAFQKSKQTCDEGSVVWVANSDGDIVATGHYSSASIMVRVLSFEKTEIDLSFYIDALQNAYDFRQKALGLPSKETNAFRLVAGEGDNLSGLIIDLYDKHAVMQCHTSAMYNSRSLISEALQKVLGKDLETIYLKSIHIKDQAYESEFLLGESPSTTILENNVNFSVDWTQGQKTGFFLDQRENRALLRQFSKNKSVLNTFCYTGGFSVYALEGNASKVVSVDISESAMEMTDKNVALNKNADRHTSVTANVLQYLKEIEDNSFDIIVLDPPAFAKNRNKSHNAMIAYKRINRIAMRKIKKGGLIFTFSCSQVIGRELFDNTVRSAAIEAGRKGKLLTEVNFYTNCKAFCRTGFWLSLLHTAWSVVLCGISVSSINWMLRS